MSSSLAEQHDGDDDAPAVDFDAAGIIPDVVSVKPLRSLKVQFVDGTVILPAHITRQQSNVFPRIILPPMPQNAKYFTLITLDPDALSRTHHWFRHALHYLHVNIEHVASSYTDVTSNNGTVIAEWAGAGPPPFTGQHRYVFLLYAHQKLLTLPGYTAPLPTSKRPWFNIEKLLAAFQADDHAILYSGTYYIAENAIQRLWGNTGEFTKEIR